MTINARAADRLLRVAELAELHHTRWGTDRSAHLWSEAIHATAAARTPGLTESQVA